MIGLLVDTESNRMWIYNYKNQPVEEALGTVIFDQMPGFQLDCIKVKNYAERAFTDNCR
jgi:hypothetical protein